MAPAGTLYSAPRTPRPAHLELADFGGSLGCLRLPLCQQCALLHVALRKQAYVDLRSRRSISNAAPRDGGRSRQKSRGAVLVRGETFGRARATAMPRREKGGGGASLHFTWKSSSRLASSARSADSACSVELRRSITASFCSETWLWESRTASSSDAML